jgi:hypothetical protein
MLCYLHRLRREALQAWRFDMTIWAAFAPHMKDKMRAPSMPRILRRPDDTRGGPDNADDPRGS